MKCCVAVQISIATQAIYQYNAMCRIRIYLNIYHVEYIFLLTLCCDRKTDVKEKEVVLIRAAVDVARTMAVTNMHISVIII